MEVTYDRALGSWHDSEIPFTRVDSRIALKVNRVSCESGVLGPSFLSLREVTDY